MEDKKDIVHPKIPGTEEAVALIFKKSIKEAKIQILVAIINSIGIGILIFLIDFVMKSLLIQFNIVIPDTSYVLRLAKMMYIFTLAFFVCPMLYAKVANKITVYIMLVELKKHQ